MMRSTIERVTFRYAFVLKGLDERQPPGTYEVETDEEPIQGLSFLAYRRVATAIRIPMAGRGAGSSQTFTIDPRDLEAARARDFLAETGP
jgi:hypothetical protein